MIWIPKLFGMRVVATIHGLDWQRSKWGNFGIEGIAIRRKNGGKACGRTDCFV